MGRSVLVAAGGLCRKAKWSVIMFFQKNRKSSKEIIAAKRTNYAGDSMDKLDKNGALPFGWVTHNQKYVDMIERDLEPFRQMLRDAKTDVEKYAALKSFLMFLQEGRAHYYEYSECVGKYFEEFICKSMEAKQRKEAFKKIESKLKGQK